MKSKRARGYSAVMTTMIQPRTTATKARMPEDDQDDVVGDGEEPLDEGEPAVEIGLGVGVLDVEVDGLVFVG